MLTYTWRRPRRMGWANAASLAGYTGGSRLPGDVREDGESQEQAYLLREIGEGELERSFRLPAAVDPAKAEAVVENGMLRLSLPKAETVRPKTIALTGK